MAQVVLDALPEEEKSRLEGKGGKLIEELDLFIHLLLEESTPKVARPDGSPEKRDASAADVVHVVHRRLGLVQGEGRAAGGEEGGDTGRWVFAPVKPQRRDGKALGRYCRLRIARSAREDAQGKGLPVRTEADVR
jgi:hypothetical protein